MRCGKVDGEGQKEKAEVSRETVDNKGIVIQHLERAWNQDNLATLRNAFLRKQSFTAGHDLTRSAPTRFERGLSFGAMHAADFQWHIDDLISEGDSVVARLTFTGTHTGMLSVASRTLPATEKPFAVGEIIIFRLVEGKIREV